MAKHLSPIWQAFEQQSLANAPTEQKIEMKKAFYMGASALLSVLQSMPDDISEEDGAEMLDQLYNECNDYLQAAAADYTRRRARGFGKGGDRP